MKVIAAIVVDLEWSPMGTRSRLADELAGVPILRRTVERLALARRIDGVHVLVPAAQQQRCAALLAGCAVTLHPHDVGPAPWTPLVRAARKWSLDGWRGGVGGATDFDVYTDCRLLNGLLKKVPADAVLSLPAAAPLIAPELADQMIAQREQAADDVRIVFTQAPPGLAGVMLDRGLIAELAEKAIPLGWIFGYQPDNPRKDLVFQPCCCEVPTEVRYASGRLLADTERAHERLAALLRDHESPDLPCIGRWLRHRDEHHTEPVPREVEIELTTDDPYPEAVLRPRGNRVGHRGPIDMDVALQVVDEICRYDDALVVLGGFGEPLRHPKFAEILEAIRSRSSDRHPLFGLAVRTAAVDLTPTLGEAMIANGVDILQIGLDAWTADLYGRLQSPGDPAAASLHAVRERVDQLIRMCGDRGSATPIAVPDLIKATDNIHELDDFFDGWIRHTGAASLTGYTHHAGQCPDKRVISMTPSTRGACRRIRSRCLVLADGAVTMCDQDLLGKHALGRIGSRSLEAIWQGEAFERLRDLHAQGCFGDMVLCEACEEWHRP